MPQMMPLNWLTLYFFFILIFFSFSILNYFTLNYKSKVISYNKKSSIYNWKW